jgi:hypothetical protein
MLSSLFKGINFSKGRSGQTRCSGLSVTAAGQLTTKRWGRSWKTFCELRSKQREQLLHEPTTHRNAI